MTESFDWNYPGLDWSHFHALANLLSLRNGGQAEPSSLPDIVLEDDWDSDEDKDGHTPSMDTRLAHQISDSGHGRLKRKFLDCLAEFAANKHGGAAVACSAMKEAEDNVLIWIARNEGFSEEDEPVFDKLGKRLSSLSSNSANQSEIDLWEEMVLYHQNRIQVSYIPNMRASFKAYDAIHKWNDTTTSENNSSSDNTLSVLRNLLFDRNTNGASILEKHGRLVIASYDVRRTSNIEKALHSSAGATPESKSLWFDICLLARLRVAFQKFKEITLKLPSFEQVTIILVPRLVTSKDPSQRELSLKETFDILQLNLSPATTKAVLGKSWTLARIERDFAKRQKQKPKIHAEVQLMMFLNTIKSSTSAFFPYLGCSKLSCFMCNRFIQSYGQIMTRGCHGRLFKPWTVPSENHLLPGFAYRTAKALLFVQKEVEKKLKDSIDGHVRLERTSVIGGSSILGDQQEQPSQRQLQIDRLKMVSERSRVAEMFRRFKRQTEDTNNSLSQTYPVSKGRDLKSECGSCWKTTRRRCSICNTGFFCSDSCQEKRSGNHLFTCSKRSLTSADYLWKSLAEDLMPQEEEVLEDFGFNNVVSGQDKTYLLGVYIGLYLSGQFSAEDIHGWRVGGILADKIKEHYFSISEMSRGQYFPWFLKNSYALGPAMTTEESQQRLIETFFDKAKPYLDDKDRNTAAMDLKPEAKSLSYCLLAQTLLRITPNPAEKNWYSFGFVTCRGQGEESILVDLYQLLLTQSDGSFFYEYHNRQRGAIQPATFTQFWKAYETGKLIQLMDSRGLKELRSRLPFLEEFLSVPPIGPRPSVWDLKQFLEINDPIALIPTRSVEVDYGFINCRTSEDTCTLMEIYKNILLTANPLDLHKACVAGDLFWFAAGHIKMKKTWEPLMRNSYPLERAMESKLEQEVRPKADEDSAHLPSLWSRLWGLVGGFAS